MGWTRSGSIGTWSRSAAHALVSLRSGSPGGRKRSSPHHRSRRRQSTESRATERASAASTAVPRPPPVRTTDADPLAFWASTTCVTSRTAMAWARPAPSRWTRTSGSLMLASLRVDDAGGLGRLVGLARVHRQGLGGAGQASQDLSVDLVGIQAPHLL